MPLTPIQQKQWESVKKTIIYQYIRQCQGKVTKGTWTMEMYTVLHHQISELVSGKSEISQRLIDIFQIYTQNLGEQKINTVTYAKALQKFTELPVVRDKLNADLMEQLSQIPNVNLALDDASSDSPDESAAILSFFDADIDTLAKNVHTWIHEHYSPVDKRIISSDERRLRRMDSIAKLLTLSQEKSVCTAVAFDPSPSRGLIIAANVTKQGLQADIFKELQAKLNVIHQTIMKISLLDNDMNTPENLDALGRQMLEELLACGLNAIPWEHSHQAAVKLIHAICFDDETFTPIEKKAFMRIAQSTLLLPNRGKDSMMINVLEINSQDEWEETRIELPNIRIHVSITDLHAEQLIAHFVFIKQAQQLNEDAPLMIGISKLCCETCFNHLSRYPVSIRGNHGQAYPGVVDLQTGERVGEVHARRHTTHAEPSPKHTPFKRRNELLPGVERKVRRSLRVNLEDDALPQSPLSQGYLGFFSTTEQPMQSMSLVREKNTSGP